SRVRCRRDAAPQLEVGGGVSPTRPSRVTGNRRSWPGRWLRRGDSRGKHGNGAGGHLVFVSGERGQNLRLFLRRHVDEVERAPKFSRDLVELVSGDSQSPV